VVSFPQVSPPKPCTHLSSPPYALHAPPISFFSILSPAQYLLYSYSIFNIHLVYLLYFYCVFLDLLIDCNNIVKRLRCLGVSVLASGTQVRGLKPGRSRRIFKGGKILSTPSFRREVKPWVPCRRFAACKRSLKCTVEVGI
jgi:hypothetical protein